MKGQNQDRSHLMAYVFGGATLSTDLPKSGEFNIVAWYSSANRTPLGMQRYESQIQARLKSPICETITYTVTAHYAPGGCSGTGCAPTDVLLTATGDKGYSLNCDIPNVVNVTTSC
jgi:hypothetical protein